MIWEKNYTVTDPATALLELVDAWNSEEYRVFVLRANSKVENIRSFFDGAFSMLGTPVALAEDVNAGGRDHQRTGEIWSEVRYDPRHPNAYRHSANAQPLHTDGSYIPEFPNATLMACVTNAGEGGETTFISSEAVISCLEAENPELLRKLMATEILHSRSGDSRCARVIETSSYPAKLNWNYYCLSDELNDAQKVIGEEFFQYLGSSQIVRDNILEVKLGAGDAVVWKDREVLHGRNEFKATRESERFLWKCAIDIGKFG